MAVECLRYHRNQLRDRPVFQPSSSLSVVWKSRDGLSCLKAFIWSRCWLKGAASVTGIWNLYSSVELSNSTNVRTVCVCIYTYMYVYMLCYMYYMYIFIYVCVMLYIICTYTYVCIYRIIYIICIYVYNAFRFQSCWGKIQSCFLVQGGKLRQIVC